LDGIYHDEATDEEESKEKALCAEEQRILMVQHCQDLHKQLPTDKEVIYKPVTGWFDVRNTTKYGC